MKETLEKLKMATRECREDMHEPEEQGLNFFITGDHMDNAFGEDPMGNEYIVCIEDLDDGYIERFNLATLIALAKKAKLD